MNIKFIQFLDHFSNFIVVKTESEIKIGRIRSNWLHINGTGINANTEVQFQYKFHSWKSDLASPKITVLFLNKLS